MILHVDMDAFYASVEQRDRPELRGKPVVVGGSPLGRGVVSAASYEARKYGIHSAMPMRRAVQLCPGAIVVKTRMQIYVQVSKQIRAIFARYTPEVEPLSLDEAFLDVSACQQLFGSAQHIGRAIKEEIWQELQLVASVGVAPNKFLAKLASDLEKPDGFTCIEPEQVLQKLAPLPVSRLWGVGKVTEQRLISAGICKFGHLQALTQEQATLLLGNIGIHLWKLSQGIDDRKVVPDREAKTISHETTFSRDVQDANVLQARLLELTEQVGMRLRSRNLQGRTVHIKLRYSDFHTITRSHSLDSPSSATEVFWRAAAQLLQAEFDKRALVVRLIGVGVSNLETRREQQLMLFDEEGNLADLRQTQTARIDSATDEIRKLFGREALQRASSLKPK